MKLKVKDNSVWSLDLRRSGRFWPIRFSFLTEGSPGQMNQLIGSKIVDASKLEASMIGLQSLIFNTSNHLESPRIIYEWLVITNS